eukprot:scaffold14170_cov45-Phaeocystis_antarctica.AAC.1
MNGTTRRRKPKRRKRKRQWHNELRAERRCVFYSYAATFEESSRAASPLANSLGPRDRVRASAYAQLPRLR